MLPFGLLESHLEDAGIRIRRVKQSSNSTRPSRFDVNAQGNKARFAVLRRKRAPYPGEISELTSELEELSSEGEPLLSAPFITEPLGRSLSQAGWSWADDAGNWDLRAPGIFLQRRVADKQRRTTCKRRMPTGPGGLKIIRWLIVHSSRSPIGATELAETVGITRPGATQVLQALARLQLCTKVSRGQWLAKKEELLDAFLEQYRGPGGTDHHFYSLRAPGESAKALAEEQENLRTTWAISADVAADLLVPHRRPSHLVVYASDRLLRLPDDWVEAHGTEDANIILRNAADESALGFELTRPLGDANLTLANPTQIMWDLLELGGQDRLEVVEKLRAWILANQTTN